MTEEGVVDEDEYVRMCTVNVYAFFGLCRTQPTPS